MRNKRKRWEKERTKVLLIHTHGSLGKNKEQVTKVGPLSKGQVTE